MPKAVIMAGGQGERFWPMTHAKFPKYRVHLGGKGSLLLATYKRLLTVYPREDIFVVTTKGDAWMIRKELPNLKKDRLIQEPFRNNTASAIFLSCSVLRKMFGDKEVVSFFPADHLIQNESLFQKTLSQAMDAAKLGRYLTTIGIRPTFPATGYGYVQRGRPLNGYQDTFIVKCFVEKPGLDKAKQYLKQKSYLWNGGIFTWRLDTFFKSMEDIAPIFGQTFNLNKLSSSYKKLPKISIDYALLEKVKHMLVIQTQMDWCDMGSWDMLHEKSPKMKNECFAYGLGYHKELDRSLVMNYTSQPVITLGVKNMIVVQTERGTLICQKTRSEEAALLFKKMDQVQLKNQLTTLHSDS